LFVSANVSFQSAAQRTRFLYVLDTGTSEFIKVDLETQRVVDHGDLSRDMRAAILLEEGDPRWHPPLLRQVLYSPQKGYIYAETQAGIARVESGDVVEQVRVMAFKLPSFELVGVIHEDDPIMALEDVVLPSLLVSQDWEQLLYFYGKQEPGKRLVIAFEWYDARTLKLIERQQRQLPDNWRELDREARNSYWDQNLWPIYRGKFNWPEQKPTEYRLKGPVPAEIERFTKQYPSSFFRRVIANERIVVWESRTREQVHKYPGKREGKEQEIEEKTQVEYSTGRFVVFDHLGKKLFEVNDKELAGDYLELRTLSPDGRTMYFAIGQSRLYAIDLTGKKPPVKIETYDLSVKSATYFFAGR
jgi:hypothetical protein